MRLGTNIPKRDDRSDPAATALFNGCDRVAAAIVLDHEHNKNEIKLALLFCLFEGVPKRGVSEAKTFD